MNEMDYGDSFSETSSSGVTKTSCSVGGGDNVSSSCIDESREDLDESVVEDFQELIESSDEMFSTLKNMPAYAVDSWQSQFSETFKIFTKLWNFQQKNRDTLVRDGNLKRWQIGEIASKLGQVYYHFYLKTSQRTHLHGAYDFYVAILKRSYYKIEGNMKISGNSLTSKRLRLLTRLITICMLLNRQIEARNHLKDAANEMKRYGKQLSRTERSNWLYILDEMKTFIHANLIMVYRGAGRRKILIDLNMNLDKRINDNESDYKLKLLRGDEVSLTIGEAIIVGSSPQVSLSGLTIDMFRMVQTLEYVDGGSDHNQNVQKLYEFSLCEELNVKEKENPRKYLLCRPNIMDLLMTLSSANKHLGSSEAMFLYLSANGITNAHNENYSTKSDSFYGGYEEGGLLINDSCLFENEENEYRECLNPGDLLAFLRKPLFMIIDSEASSSFHHLPSIFNQPYIFLLSAQNMPHFIEDITQGRLMTRFLNNPTSTFLILCQIYETSEKKYCILTDLINDILTEIREVLVGSALTDCVFLSFLGNDFFQTFIIRFILFRIILHFHRDFPNDDESFHPLSSPEIELEIFTNSNSKIVSMMKDLVEDYDVEEAFDFSEESNGN